MSGVISKVIVKLNGLQHTYPDDIDILLVGPGGERVMLMSDAGGSKDVVNVNLTFDSATLTAVQTQIRFLPEPTARPIMEQQTHSVHRLQRGHSAPV